MRGEIYKLIDNHEREAAEYQRVNEQLRLMVNSSNEMYLLYTQKYDELQQKYHELQREYNSRSSGSSEASSVPRSESTMHNMLDVLTQDRNAKPTSMAPTLNASMQEREVGGEGQEGMRVNILRNRSPGQDPDRDGLQKSGSCDSELSSLDFGRSRSTSQVGLGQQALHKLELAASVIFTGPANGAVPDFTADLSDRELKSRMEVPDVGFHHPENLHHRSYSFGSLSSRDGPDNDMGSQGGRRVSSLAAISQLGDRDSCSSRGSLGRAEEQDEISSNSKDNRSSSIDM